MIKNCKECDIYTADGRFCNCLDEDEECNWCCGKQKIITNADRIRAMTDEELADEIVYILNYVLWLYDDSRLGLLDWLKQEVTE